MTHQEQAAFENIVGKGEIAHNKQFLLFPQWFLLHQISVSPFVHIFDIVSLFAVEMEESKTGISGKGLSEMKTSKVNACTLLFLSYFWKKVISLLYLYLLLKWKSRKLAYQEKD